MAGLGGGLSGLAFVGSGYDQGAQDYWRTKQLEQDNQAQIALGKGLQLLRESPVPGATTMPDIPVPQQLRPVVGGPSSQPGPQASPVSPLPDGSPGSTSPSAVNGQPQNYFTGPTIPPGGTGQMAQLPGSQPVPQMPPTPARSPAPQMPPTPARSPAPQQAQPQTGIDSQGMPMDLRVLIDRISAANPGIAPQVLAGAVTKALPLLQVDSQQYWHMLNAELTRQRIEMTGRGQGLRAQTAADQEAGRNQRAGMKPEVQALDRFLEKNPNATPEQMAEFIRSTKISRATGVGTPSQQLLKRFYDEHPNATTEEGAAFLKSQKATPATDIKQQQSAQAAQSVMAQIDSALKDVNDAMHGGASVTGITGRIQRGFEFFGGTAGMDTGTTASDFQTKIRLIQTQLPRLIAGTSRLSADERAHLEEVVKGLGTFTNPEQAKTALEYVKSVIQSRMGIGQPIGAPGTAPAKPTGQPQPTNQVPPVSILKEGVATHFKNGSTWTLQNGEAVRLNDGGEGARPFDPKPESYLDTAKKFVRNLNPVSEASAAEDLQSKRFKSMFGSRGLGEGAGGGSVSAVKPWTTGQIAYLKSQYEKGVPAEKIAGFLGRSTQAIRGRIAELRRTGDIKPVERQVTENLASFEKKIIELRKQGLSAQSIADELGVSKGVVTGRLDRMKNNPDIDLSFDEGVEPPVRFGR